MSRVRILLPLVLVLTALLVPPTKSFAQAAPLPSGLAAGAAQQPLRTGILLLAHGGSAVWNDNVRAIAAEVDNVRPTEVAFGMATRANIQSAIDRLAARGVTRIVAVPLFVSSHSSVITSTQYLLGLRREMPPDLVRFAKMSHGSGGQTDHAAHLLKEKEEDGTTPVRSPVPVSMTAALDAHPVVGAIVSSRAAAISREPAQETVILVAHGPVDDESNDKWLASLREVAATVKASAGYAVVDAITVRDDAPPAVRDRAAAELRVLVEHRGRTTRVLVVPVLLSYGGIEEGLRKRLTGLEYTMAIQALAPDARLAAWVLEMSAAR
jgi:sirohydrochlorin ferrochelatase